MVPSRTVWVNRPVRHPRHEGGCGTHRSASVVPRDPFRGDSRVRIVRWHCSVWPTEPSTPLWFPGIRNCTKMQWRRCRRHLGRRTWRGRGKRGVGGGGGRAATCRREGEKLSVQGCHALKSCRGRRRDFRDGKLPWPPHLSGRCLRPSGHKTSHPSHLTPQYWYTVKYRVRGPEIPRCSIATVEKNAQ